MKLVQYFFNEHSELGLRFKLPQGTYLAWIDCSRVGLTENELQNQLINVGHVGIMKGSTYGDRSRLRMNIACPREKVEDGLQRILTALK